jgi:peptide/nickel transport system substrate-binding protein
MVKRLKWKVMSVAPILLFLVLLVPSFSQVDEIRIADSKGNWGYPNPYRHYPRGPGYVRMSWVFDTLVWKDSNGYIPALAKSWSFDPKKLAFTFELNSKAKWHDGQPLTAEDVVFTIGYFKKHSYQWITVDDVSRAEAEGPYRVVIHLSKPYSPFLSDIGGTMPILPRHIWESVDRPESYDNPKAYIGSGPYLFRDFNKAQGTYLYEAFVDYYQGRPKADQLIYVHSGKPLVSLANGEVDLASIQPEMAKPLKQKGMVIIKDERGWNKKLMINHRKPPFNEKRFRQPWRILLINRKSSRSHIGGLPPLLLMACSRSTTRCITRKRQLTSMMRKRLAGPSNPWGIKEVRTVVTFETVVH